MGANWCRDRTREAQNSKSPVDRILVFCSNVISPKQTTGCHSKPADDFVFQQMRKTRQSAPPIVNLRPPRTRQNRSQWKSCTLSCPDEDILDGKSTPIPPPRKKRKRRVTSLELLNSQLDMLQKGEDIVDWQNETNNMLEPNNNIQPSEPIKDKKNKTHFLKSQGRKDRHVLGKKLSDDNKQKMKVVKTSSTISLPNYEQLVKHEDENQSVPHPPPRNISSVSLPGEGATSMLSSLSEATIQRLENYMKKCRSFSSLRPQQLLEKLEEVKNKPEDTRSESSDSWSGLDDWDVRVIEFEGKNSTPPSTPITVEPTKKKAHFQVGQSDDDVMVEERVISDDETKEEGESTHSILLDMLMKFSKEENMELSENQAEAILSDIAVGRVPMRPNRRHSHQYEKEKPSIERQRSLSLRPNVDDEGNKLTNYSNLTTVEDLTKIEDRLPRLLQKEGDIEESSITNSSASSSQDNLLKLSEEYFSKEELKDAEDWFLLDQEKKPNKAEATENYLKEENVPGKSNDQIKEIKLSVLLAENSSENDLGLPIEEEYFTSKKKTSLENLLSVAEETANRTTDRLLAEVLEHSYIKEVNEKSQLPQFLIGESVLTLKEQETSNNDQPLISIEDHFLRNEKPKQCGSTDGTRKSLSESLSEFLGFENIPPPPALKVEEVDDECRIPPPLPTTPPPSIEPISSATVDLKSSHSNSKENLL